MGVLYTLRRTAEGWEGPVNKRIYATFQSHEALFAWLSVEARKRGYGTKPTLFLADGARAIWLRQQRYFQKATPCLDGYHGIMIVEKLWAVGARLHRSGSPALTAWVQKQKDRLRAGESSAVLATLKRAWQTTPKTGPGNKAKRVALKRTWLHLYNNRERLSYQKCRARGWPIGSGNAEGAVRNLIEIRHDGPGMRWGRVRAELVLHLRCILLNGQWDEFEAFLDGHPKLKLASHPTPATPHLAKTKKAA